MFNLLRWHIRTNARSALLTYVVAHCSHDPAPFRVTENVILSGRSRIVISPMCRPVPKRKATSVNVDMFELALQCCEGDKASKPKCDRRPDVHSWHCQLILELVTVIHLDVVNLTGHACVESTLANHHIHFSSNHAALPVLPQEIDGTVLRSSKCKAQPFTLPQWGIRVELHAQRAPDT